MLLTEARMFMGGYFFIASFMRTDHLPTPSNTASHTQKKREDIMIDNKKKRKGWPSMAS
jgi:hypothetical protein